jgi:hypothetical protein
MLADPNNGPWHLDRMNYTMEEVATKVRRYLYEERIKAAGIALGPMTSLQFWVGGYGAKSDHAEVWQVVIENGTCPDPVRTLDGATCGWQCSGQPEALNRLLLGYSQRLPDLLAAHGVDATVATKVMADLGGDPTAQLIEPSMPTQDAIALTEFLAETVKGYVRFLPGPDTVGGSTDVAVVTKHEGFKWIRRKHYYPPSLNVETDHV